MLHPVARQTLSLQLAAGIIFALMDQCLCLLAGKHLTAENPCRGLILAQMLLEVEPESSGLRVLILPQS